MPSKADLFAYVLSLSQSDFQSLQKAVTYRANRNKYGFSTLDEAAEFYGRPVRCPDCRRTHCVSIGSSPGGNKRFQCRDCGRKFSYLSGTVFFSTKRDFDFWERYITCMVFCPTEELASHMCGISHPTAHLWRHKIFATVDGYQDHLILSDRIWIDETYLNDTRIMHEFGKKRKRGLSKDQICIVVAIDVHKNMIAIQCGNGNPTGNRIEGALLNHIKPGSVIVHDGNAAHNQLIAKAGCTSEVYKADTDDPKYIEQMQLINNMCGWLQRFLYKVIGMRMENLQSYLNWFVYLFRIKRDDEKYPKVERVIRHLLLTDTQYVRKY